MLLHITMSKEEDICWFHQNLTREEAETLLLEGKHNAGCTYAIQSVPLSDNKPDGSFLVRKSSSSVGDYALSVLHDSQVSHFQIRRHADDAFFSIGNKTGPQIPSRLIFQSLLFQTTA